jgi:hypothetical protein
VISVKDIRAQHWIDIGSFGSYTLDWLWVPLLWDNPSCDGYPAPYGPPVPTTSYYLTEELLGIAGGQIVDAVQSGAAYWGSVGSSLGYSALQTPIGADVPFYHWRGSGVPPSWIAQYYPERVIEINWQRHGGSLNTGQWAYTIAHELGHAIGLDNTAADNNTVMAETLWTVPDMNPRDLDKCGAVGIFPVNIQIQ